MTSPARAARRAAVIIAFVFACVLPAAPAQAAPTHYVEMSDGASIAINVKVPPQCTALNRRPTFFEMSGYESGSDEGKTPAGHLADQTGLPFPLQTGTRAAHASHVDDRYVTVLASVRGTGCSSGEFDLFSWRSALDGKEVIDKWIAQQPWSDGNVVIFGHSYSGITGLMVASTKPDAPEGGQRLRADRRHLPRHRLSGRRHQLRLPAAVDRRDPACLRRRRRHARRLYPVEDTSAQCAANQAERRRALLEDPLIHGLDDTDGEWYRSRSLVNFVDRINVPVHITSAYQDEQTGPRGPTYVFDKLSDRSQAPRAGQRCSRHQHRGPHLQGPHRLDGLLDARQELGRPRHEDRRRQAPEVFGPRTTPTEDLTRDPRLPGRRQGRRRDRLERVPARQTRFTDLSSPAAES